MNHAESLSLMAQAEKVIPGGVNSPVRAFCSVGGAPIFYDHAKGSRVWDVDGNEYIDFVGSWGPMILGHTPDAVLDVVREQLGKGTSFGAPTPLEVTMAEAIVGIVPSIEMVRMVSSGTEATMSALRLARGFTGRDKFIKFDGNYHGHSDALLSSAGSGLITFGIPSTPGVTAGASADTIVLPYNDVAAVLKAFEEYGNKIAAVIVEPVAGNMGVIPPRPGFLEGLRAVCDAFESVLIFDEVITGFRVSLGGAQQRYDVTPDLTTLGKIIGGGFPVGAFGGRADIMERLAPVGPVYQAGTLSGNPIAMVAGLALIDQLRKPGVYAELERKGARFSSGLCRAAERAGVEVCCTRVGSMSCMFFTDADVHDWETAATSDVDMYARYFRGMLERGFTLAPSQFEAAFVSLAHTDEDIDAAVAAAGEVLAGL
jgi:glutamate-1-semialdehyde 2,1-aminomutase